MYLFEIKNESWILVWKATDGYRVVSKQNKKPTGTWDLNPDSSFYNIPYNIFTKWPKKYTQLVYKKRKLTNDSYNLFTNDPTNDTGIRQKMSKLMQFVAYSSDFIVEWLRMMHFSWPNGGVFPSSCCLGMFATPQPEFCRKKKTPLLQTKPEKSHIRPSDLDLSASLYL